ncbi:hypothetical protein FHY52_00540 [Nocardia nova]|nr:hypothetical protein [Nocardia nova]MDN2495213.1 hypothetical protein [Nocardia nova]
MATETLDPKTGTPDDAPAASPRARRRTVSLRLSTVATAAVALIAVAVIAVLAMFLWSARGDISAREAADSDRAKAEQVASDYAVGASTIDYKNANAWLGKLQAGTSAQLADKFKATAPQLEAILTPLQWNSTAQPITAKVMSESNGVYKVDVFLNVSSTSAQTPQGGQTTVTYNVSLDRNSGWKITDVGGMDGALPLK